jgi:hypothetical protein
MRAFNSAAAAAVLLAAALIAQPPNAGAALSTVSPGDRIDTPNLCTIGYTYTGRDEHTYAITAGHCATGEGRPVRTNAAEPQGRSSPASSTHPAVAAPTTAYSALEFACSR